MARLGLLLALAVLAVSTNAAAVKSLSGDPWLGDALQPLDVANKGPGDETLIPLMAVYSNAQKEAKKAAIKADYMKTAKLGDSESITATLAGGDGEAHASEAESRAKAAVNGVAKAKDAMLQAQEMLSAAEHAAEQAQSNAQQSVQEDQQDMSNIVKKAVRAAEEAERTKVASLKSMRLGEISQRDKAFKDAEKSLMEKRNEALKTGDVDIEASNEKLRLMEAEGPANVASSIADRMQSVTSPQKIAAMSATLMSSMGQSNDVAESSVSELPSKLGESKADGMSHDEHVFDNVLNEMKQAVAKGAKGHTGATPRVNLVPADSLKQLADEQVALGSKLHTMEDASGAQF